MAEALQGAIAGETFDSAYLGSLFTPGA